MPPDVACTPMPEIAVVPAGESVQVPAEFDVGGSARPIRLELRNDRGLFNITFNLESYELIQPAHGMSHAEFETHQGEVISFADNSC